MTTPTNPRGLRDLPFKLPEVTRAQKDRARRVLKALCETYPDAHCELDYTEPHELVIATILSAQATDVGVNKATPKLFKTFPTPADYAASTPAKIEPYIKTIGLYRNKAKSVHAAMTTLVDDFEGVVPDTMDELLTLRGVARKTANVVLGNAFNTNVGFVVDTHVERISKRLGLVPEDATVAMTERYLCALMPRDTWCDASHMLIFHGRRACKAKMTTHIENDICKKYG
ncbi:MAG: endonuclease III, partial [Planctomycetota bacterium]